MRIQSDFSPDQVIEHALTETYLMYKNNVPITAPVVVVVPTEMETWVLAAAAFSLL
jgi:hypothetical protein